MTELVLPGLRGGSPAAALALYGIAWLVPAGSTMRWVGNGLGDWVAAVDADVPDIAAMSATVVEAIKVDDLRTLQAVAGDINQVTPEQFAAPRTAAVRRVLVGLAAEAPLLAKGNVARTPICVVSFRGKRNLFGSAAKQDKAMDVQAVRRLLSGEAEEQKGCNTLGFDPAARRQDGAVIGPDPSADGVRGIPGLVPLILRGLATVAPMPGAGRSTQGGAFVRIDRRVEFRWPIFSSAVRCDALPFLVARDWGARSASQRAASGIDAVYASTVLREELRLGHGRRIA